MLQADIKKSVDSNGGIQYLFNSNGISAYNRIFAQFLQDNELQEGDTVEDKILYQGDYLNEDNNSCLIYIIDSHYISWQGDIGSYPEDCPIILQWGSPFKYTTQQLIGMSSATYNVGNLNVTQSIDSSNYETNTIYKFGVNGDIVYSNGKINSNQSYWGNGYIGIYKNINTGKYYLGKMSFGRWKYNNQSADRIWGKVTFSSLGEITSNNNIQPVTIFITTNNKTINNNNYEGDTIINNNGNPSSPDTPVVPPSPDYSPAEDWDIELPDLNVPNWILSGKENKFPFDIPFNVMYALTLLQAEPEAPHLEGTLDLGVYQWDYDLDLSQFDTVAIICRNMEFLAFLTGLMLMTRKLIWG